MFYTNIELIGNKIHERYIDDNGKDCYRVVDYKPSLFIHAKDGTASKHNDIYDKPCTKKTFITVKEARDWANRMKEVGIEVLGNQTYVNAYITDTYKGTVDYNRDDLRIACIDIEVTAPEFPEPKHAKYEIDMISHMQMYKGKMTNFVFDLVKDVGEWKPEKSVLPKDHVDSIQYFAFHDEKDLLLNYLQFWKENTPHFLTDWHGLGFDIPYIVNRYRLILGNTAANMLSPFNKIKERKFIIGNEEKIEYTLMGIAHLDYMELYKTFSYTPQPTYNLGYVANKEIKATKLDYEGPIHLFRGNDHQRYVDYCCRDTSLILDMDNKRNFISLVLSLSYYSKMNFEDVFSSLRTWDAILFNSLYEQKKVVPQKRHNHKESFPGGFVKEPIKNRYGSVLSFDLTSLYPSIIRQLNISTETFVGMFNARLAPEYINKTAPRPSDEYSCAPNGAMYRKDIKGFIPIEIKKVFDQRKEEKGYMLAAQRNREAIKKILSGHNGSSGIYSGGIELHKDFSAEHLDYLRTLSVAELKELAYKCEMEEALRNTNQLVRKILINSLYGALGSEHFRFYSLANASAVTTFGQLAIQWIERKINEYLSKVLGITADYVIAIDTDSVYVNVDDILDKVGRDKFKDTNHMVDFLDKFAREKMEPMINESYLELKEYMNNVEHLMFMDREAISLAPMGTDGIGGFWTGKKRYALNIYDMEGTRYAEPKLKIMGLETQRSSTPEAIRTSLKECIRIMLQEGEASLQEYVKTFKNEMKTMDYRLIANASSANGLSKWSDSKGYPIKGTPKHVKGTLLHNRLATKYGFTPIIEGSKVMVLPLKNGNTFQENAFSWSSGDAIPEQISKTVLAVVDWNELSKKTFDGPLESIGEATRLSYEKRATLSDLFDF